MKELALEMFNYIFGGGMFDQMTKILNANPSSSSSLWNDAWLKVNTVYHDYMLPIGLGLMIIWFLVAFLQKASSEQMNFDQIFLLFVKLFVSFYLIEHGIDILTKIWGLGISVTKDLGNPDFDKAGVSTQILHALWKDLSGKNYPDLAGFWKSIGMVLQLAFPWLIAAILSGVATFIAYSRMLEMMLRVAVAPVALSDFFNEGLHSNAWRYIKSFLAICLQGFCIVLIAQLYAVVAGSLIRAGGFMDGVVQYLVVSFSAVALMFKASSFCKELVGA